MATINNILSSRIVVCLLPVYVFVCLVVFNVIKHPKQIFHLNSTGNVLDQLQMGSDTENLKEKEKEKPALPQEPSQTPSLPWYSMRDHFHHDCLREAVLGRENKLPLHKRDFDFLLTDEGRKYKKILTWTNAYGAPTYGFGNGYENFRRSCCKEHRCFLTSIRYDPRFPVEGFDAVVFHFRSTRMDDLPKKRSDHQRWVFFEVESPGYSYQNPAKYNHLFNWTMTYRRDSDVYHGYGTTIPIKDLFPNNQTLLRELVDKPNYQEKNKRTTVAWMVSHCNTLSRRERFVKKLKKYISIDIYGNCGTLKCSRSNSTECYKMAERKYKFYLSFENSVCKDYITEKLFNILKYNIVPVVYGYGDYSAVAPPHSYIDAKKFESASALAQYLIYLNNNDTAYGEYLAWKEEYIIYGMHSRSFCALCARLHSDNDKKTYDELSKWFLDDAHCERSLTVG